MDEEQRIHDVLDRLAAGQTRDEIASEYGLKNKASLDQLMRRRDFRWDEPRRTYSCGVSGGVPQRVKRIILEFRSVTADSKQIATRLGFPDHKAMADFMRQNGFEWSTEIRNYVPQRAKPTEHEAVLNERSSETVEPSINWSDFIPLLQFLNDNRGRLYTLLDQTPPRTLTVPRFGVGGGHTVKSVQLATVLEELVRDFSNEKKISQREIFEVALIQFLYRYGYGKRVEHHLISEPK